MPDMEKVIKAWEIFRDSNPYEICSGREFRAIREPEYCMGQMIEDTLAMLKEREAKNGYWINPTSQECHCSECGEQPVHEPGESVPLYDFCPYCGAKMEVKWNEQP